MKGVQIALTGNMRSGKDTVAHYLVEKYQFLPFAFGDGITETTRKLFPREYEKGKKPRKLLQDFGQFCVSQYQNVWIDYLFREMLWLEVDPVTDSVVISDLRQPHEYKALKEAGFSIIRVNADEELRKKRIISNGEEFNTETFYHETESHVNEFEVDFEIWNNGSTENLFKQVDKLMKGVL